MVKVFVIFLFYNENILNCPRRKDKLFGSKTASFSLFFTLLLNVKNRHLESFPTQVIYSVLAVF